ncbi:glutamine and serine-rich protein 1 [Plakobranchus ocellatus]|uniref:Glutamine and serine-rich protein 1 n=1 Tax=Plakobranchus ocellatus TaxID=259542 RepID=A0AAV4CPL0_9GAST|nr:glutamine and serine-rich protein 1 [Plakobranchus ocellatus]
MFNLCKVLGKTNLLGLAYKSPSSKLHHILYVFTFLALLVTAKTMEVTANGAEAGDADVKVKLESEPKTENDAAAGLKRNSETLKEDNEENESQSPPAKRGRGGSNRGRGRGRGRGSVDQSKVLDKTARIVLKHIDADGQGAELASPAKSPRGRGRPRGARNASQATPLSQPQKTSSGRIRKPTAKVKQEEEERKAKEGEQLEEVEDEEDPSFEEEEDDDEEEEFVPSKKSRGRGRPPSTPGRGRGTKRGRGRGRGRPPVKSENEEEEEEDNEDEEEEMEEPEDDADAAEDSANADPEAIKTGQFLIDKNDIRRIENFPIWRMEGPNMLRKFEMIVQLGRIRHRSLYAYSSWAQSMRDLYDKIRVTQISSLDGEVVVEVQDECLPKPPDLSELEVKYGNNELLPLFTSLVSILFQQAADTNFLATAYANNDTSVVEPVSKIDNLVRNRLDQIESEISLKDDFKARIRDCPNMKSIRRSNWSQTDQSTHDHSSEKGVRSVLLFGYGYDAATLAEDRARGAEVASVS